LFVDQSCDSRLHTCNSHASWRHRLPCIKGMHSNL